MTIVVLSKENSGISAIREAVSCYIPLGEVQVFDDAEALMERVLDLGELSGAVVFVDLAGGGPAARLFKWLKLAPGTRDLKVIAFGGQGFSVQKLIDSWGSDAVLTKPLDVDVVRSILLGDDSETVAPEAINLCSPGVLYVADHPADWHLFSTAIAQSSATFSLQFLESPAHVIEYLREQAESRRITSGRPFCLLLDTTSAGESTHNVLRWIRDQSGFPELWLVVLSQKDDPESIRTIYGAGADYYLLKPKSFEGLTAIIEVIDAGLRQTPPQLQGFTQLAEYRDPLGRPSTPGVIRARCAE
jgi:CheY-like chemotaxis protein